MPSEWKRAEVGGGCTVINGWRFDVVNDFVPNKIFLCGYPRMHYRVSHQQEIIRSCFIEAHLSE